MKKKILIIGPFPVPINGCSLANLVLYNNILIKGIPVDFINTASSVISSHQGTEFSSMKVLKFISTYKDIFKVFKSRIVYTTPGQTFYGVLKYSPFYLLCLIIKIPYIIHVHGNYLGNEFNVLTGFKKKIFKYFLSNSSAGIVLSDSLRSNFDNILPKEKVFVVNNFAQNNLFEMKNLSKKYDKLRILYLSNLMEEKGILVFLDSLSVLKQRGIDFYAQIAGKIEDSIKHLVKDKLLSLSDNVKYFDVVEGSTKVDLLLSSNVFVLPTYYTMEGQPIAILEALATGNIVISTLHAGIPDIINNKNGFLIKPKSVDELVASLDEIKENLNEYIARFSVTNKNYAIKNFTEEIFTSKILSIINELSAVR